MMRLLLLAIAFLGLPAAAHAASPGLSDDFIAICGANRTDMSKAVETARARGWTPVAVKTPANLTAMTALTRKVDGSEWAVVVGRGVKAASGRTPAQNYQTCNVTGVAAGPADADAVRRWAGAPANMASSYFFTEVGGRRTALNTADNDLMLRELRGGGHFLLQINERSGFTSLLLTRSNAAP